MHREEAGITMFRHNHDHTGVEKLFIRDNWGREQNVNQAMRVGLRQGLLQVTKQDYSEFLKGTVSIKQLQMGS